MPKPVFVYRIDDVTPRMDHEEFERHLDLFGQYEVRPLLGVVPDNRDPKLEVDKEKPDFWDRLRQLVADDRVEIAQHGYQHLYASGGNPLFGRLYGFPARSEFAGLSYKEQRRKMEAGRRILNERGLATDVWMAPSHTSDRTTLRVLADLGFRAVSDGIALYPFRLAGLKTFVPQQLWEPKSVPLGVWTICLHPNNRDRRLLGMISRHLASGARCVGFGDASLRRRGLHHGVLNAAFRPAYAGNIARHRLRTWLQANE